MNLTIGNTAVIAKKIQELTGSLFQIQTVKAYPPGSERPWLLYPKPPLS